MRDYVRTVPRLDQLSPERQVETVLRKALQDFTVQFTTGAGGVVNCDTNFTTEQIIVAVLAITHKVDFEVHAVFNNLDSLEKCHTALTGIISAANILKFRLSVIRNNKSRLIRVTRLSTIGNEKHTVKLKCSNNE